MSERQLPKKSLAFLYRFCPDHMVEGIVGDLIQEYEKTIINMEKRKQIDHLPGMYCASFIHI